MRSNILLVVCCVAAGGMLSAAETLTRKLGDAFEKKIVLVQRQSETPSKTTRSTSFSEDELNSYLKFKATGLLPTGLTEPFMTLIGNGKVTGTAVVDLDIVRQKQGSGSWFDPTSYLTGKLPVMATGTIVTGDGKGRFGFERVEVSGVPVPKALLAQMVNYFTRTANNPRGSGIDDTYELPAEIQRIDVGAARFTVIQ
jgi:hypothetical protein